MPTEDHRTPEDSRGTQQKPGTEGFIKEVGRGVGQNLLRETGTTIKWAVCGAVVGAVVLGGLGFWKFGAVGLGVGAIIGAVVGGATGGWVYLSA